MHKSLYTSFLGILLLLSTSNLIGQNLGVTSISSPVAANLNCASLPRTDNVVVRVTNFGVPLTNFDISYRLSNGSTITETYTGANIATNGFVDYTFTTPLTTSVGGANTLKVFTSLPGDVNRANDTGLINFRPRVNTFPYFESFEGDDGGFTAGGTNSTWVWGARNKPNTGGAGHGTKCWTNGGLTGYYNNSDASFLQTPCYDFTNLKNPYIAFKFVVEVENGWESVTLEYSLNGSTWAVVGTSGEANNCETNNWFNSGTTWAGNARSYPCSSWGGGCTSGICGAWTRGQHCLNNLAGQPRVQFRWRFASSGTQCTAEGFAVDSLVLGEAPVLSPFAATVPATVCQAAPAFFTSTSASCYKNSRWDFGDGTPIFRNLIAAHAYKDTGTYTVKYMADGLCGKVDTLFRTIKVLAAPATSINTFAPNICKSGTSIALTGTPSGGTFYIDSIKQSTIDPAALSLGKHFAYYEYKDPGTGCKAKDTSFFNVYVPTATIDNLGGQYCPTAPSFKLKGTPAGGIFNINGVNDSIINPFKLGLGTHTVLYAYQDSIGCPASDSKTFDVNNSLFVNLGALNSFYCAGEAPIQLTGTPTGGIFYVNGKPTNAYDPAALITKTGKDTVSYFYTDGSCANADTLYVDVIKNNPIINGLNPIYCYDANAITLNATPAGGIFTLDGNPLFTFNPKTTSTGAHRLVYTYQDPTYNCIDSVISNITIDKPTAKITGLQPNYCIDAAPVTFAANPSGGTYTLNGAPATQLNPATQGIGNNRVIYTYTNANTCVTRDTLNIAVVGLPSLQFTGFVKNLCFNSNPFALASNPSGGVYSIDGLPVSSNNFDPGFYQPGKYHVVQYTYVDFLYGCVNTIKDSVFIGTPPPVAINGLNTQYCNSDIAQTLSGTPAGGQFTINGAVASSFSPQNLGTGNHTVKYSYTDANGCSNEIDMLVDVISNPGDTIVPGPIINICRGEEVTLNVSGSLPGVWSTTQTTPSITVKPQVNTTYWYQVTDCANYYDSVDVIVSGNPQAQFTYTPKEGFLPLEITAKNTSTNISSFKWFVEGKEITGDPLKHTFETSGIFKVKLAVLNSNGCADTIEQEVTVYEGISIPNVFSPEGDGVNDNFGPITQGTFTDYSFKIFNRWGTQVFEASRPQDRWDGTFNGNPSPDGTYFYLLVAKNLKEFKLEGTVTLIR